MKRKVLLIATLDTKGKEAKYLRDKLEERGLEVFTIDSGILDKPTHVEPTITREEIASAAGVSLEAMQKIDRGPAISQMSIGVEKCCLRLYSSGRVDGVLAIGGGAGSLLAAPAIKALPIGLPKILISVVACGRSTFDPFVGTKDVTIIHTVVDILGLNPILNAVFNNAVNAMVGMVGGGQTAESWPDCTVGITMLGNTTPCVMRVKELLEKEGYLVICFHANGAGGRAFEQFVSENKFCGVLDITTHELTDEIAGGLSAAGPHRLEAAGASGIPQIVVPGGVEFIVDGPMNEIRSKWPNRKLYPDNPVYTLIRATREELNEVARQMAMKLNAAKGKVTLVLPSKGFSKANRPGTAIYDPDEDAHFCLELRKQLTSHINVVEINAHVNEPLFANALVEEFKSIMSRL